MNINIIIQVLNPKLILYSNPSTVNTFLISIFKFSKYNNIENEFNKYPPRNKIVVNIQIKTI